MHENSYKKKNIDKVEMEHYNSRLDQRNFEISYNRNDSKNQESPHNVTRLINERDIFRGTDDNVKKELMSKKMPTQMNKSKTGEITGDSFDFI